MTTQTPADNRQTPEQARAAIKERMMRDTNVCIANAVADSVMIGLRSCLPPQASTGREWERECEVGKSSEYEGMFYAYTTRPLDLFFLHPNGRWSKELRGSEHYFSSESAARAALAQAPDPRTPQASPASDKGACACCDDVYNCSTPDGMALKSLHAATPPASDKEDEHQPVDCDCHGFHTGACRRPTATPPASDKGKPTTLDILTNAKNWLIEIADYDTAAKVLALTKPSSTEQSVHPDTVNPAVDPAFVTQMPAPAPASNTPRLFGEPKTVSAPGDAAKMVVYPLTEYGRWVLSGSAVSHKASEPERPKCPKCNSNKYVKDTDDASHFRWLCTGRHADGYPCKFNYPACQICGSQLIDYQCHNWLCSWCVDPKPNTTDAVRSAARDAVDRIKSAKPEATETWAQRLAESMVAAESPADAGSVSVPREVAEKFDRYWDSSTFMPDGHKEMVLAVRVALSAHQQTRQRDAL